MSTNDPNIVKIPLKLPAPTPKSSNSFVELSPLDVVHSTFEAQADIVLTGSVPYSNSMCELTASLTAIEAVSAGSNNSQSASTSAYFNHMRRFFQLRGFTPSFREDRSLTSFVASAGTGAMGLSAIGIVALIKDVWGDGIKEGSLTASCSGTASGQTYVGELVDTGSAELVAKSDSNKTIGVIFNDDGMFVVTAAGSSNVINSITSVSFKTKTTITNISVFCKCPPDRLNFTYHPSAFNQDPLTSSLTASTSGAIYSISGQTMDTYTLSGVDNNPRITGIGLYNDNNELLVVAKVSQPISKLEDMDLCFRISLDI